jgi:diguanylate cyclase (GGDEF)-like protein
LSTFLTALVVSWISIDTIHRNLRQQIEARFPAVLDRRTEAIEEILSEGLAGLVDAGQQSPLAAKLTGHSSTSKTEKALKRTLDGLPELTGLAMIDDRGVLRAQVGATDWPTEFPETISESQEIVALRSADGTGVVLARAPLRRGQDGDPIGLLVGAFALEPMERELLLERDEGPGRILLVDRAGAPIITPADDANGRYVGLPVDRLLSEDHGGVSEYTAPDGHHMLGHARVLNDSGWVLVLVAPFDAVFAPVVSIVKRIFLSDLAVILLFSLLAYKVTSTIMSPIEALSEGAARISKGDIEHEIAIPKSNDEIGLLTRTFNDMMRKLRQSQNEIEQDKLRLTEQNEELQCANEVLAQLSITDGLTKLHNHRYFQDHLTREIKRLSRTGGPLSMILIDLDDFKRLNDRHGHSAGDEVLMNIASLMNDSVRESDLLARYGGEEFVILTPNTDLAGAVALAEKMRMNVESGSQIVDDSMRPVKVTISCGVAQFRGDRKRFFQAADRALYQAKGDGKNCVISAEDTA